MFTKSSWHNNVQLMHNSRECFVASYSHFIRHISLSLGLILERDEQTLGSLGQCSALGCVGVSCLCRGEQVWYGRESAQLLMTDDRCWCLLVILPRALVGWVGGNKMLTRPNGFQSQTSWTVGPMKKGAQLSSGEQSPYLRSKRDQPQCSQFTKMLTRPEK